MNKFDFYAIKAYSKSIRSLMKLGVERKSIETKIHYGGRFPTKEHSVSLAYVDVMHVGHKKASEMADNIAANYSKKPNLPGDVKIHIRFFPVD